MANDIKADLILQGTKANLEDLDDVVITAVVDSDNLRYDSGTSKWVNAPNGNLPADSVSFAEMQDIPTNSLIGRDTAATGNPESILLNSTLEMDGSLNLQRAALTGDVTASAGSNTTAIANDAVTFAKMLNATGESKLIGRGEGSGAGDFQEITLGTGLSMTGTVISSSGGSGDAVSVNSTAATDADFDDADPAAPAGGVNVKFQINTATSPDSISAHLAANDVSDTVLRDSAEYSVIGKFDAGSGDPADIVSGTNAVFGRVGGDLAFAQVVADQIESDAVTTVKILDANVTLAKIVNVSAASKLIGRGSAGGAGVQQEITVGSGLSMSGTTLSASAGGTNTSKAVALTAHGFAVGDQLDHNGTNYTKAKADAASTSDVLGTVSVVTDADNFTIIFSGEITTLSGLTGGSQYFLSTTTAGAATLTDPGDGNIVKPVYYAISSTVAIVGPQRGIQVNASAPVIAYTKKTADQSIADTTLVNITSLSFSVTSGRYYKFSFDVVGNTSDTNDGLKVTLTTPTFTVFDATVRIPTGDTDDTTSLFRGNIAASGETVSATTFSANGVSSTCRVEGTILPSANGTLQVQAANTAGTGPLLIKQGSCGLLWDLGT